MFRISHEITRPLDSPPKILNFCFKLILSLDPQSFFFILYIHILIIYNLYTIRDKVYTKNKKRISKDISKDSDSQTKIVQRSIKSQMRETMYPRRESRIFRHIMAFFSLLHRDLICDPLPHTTDNSSTRNRISPRRV